ncbi:MAG: hypothetical protein ABIJ95_12330 [Pseudomonadota bacterium]
MLLGKKMLIGLGVAGALVLGQTHFSHAEFYRFINEDGVVCYTDDVSQVPAESWVETKAYESVASPESKPVTEVAGEGGPGEPESAGEEEGGQETAGVEPEKAPAKDPVRDKYLGRRQEIESRREQARLGYARAMKENDKVQAELYMQEYRDLNGEISALRKEVLDAYGGEMPGWW